MYAFELFLGLERGIDMFEIITGYKNEDRVPLLKYIAMFVQK